MRGHGYMLDVETSDKVSGLQRERSVTNGLKASD